MIRVGQVVPNDSDLIFKEEDIAKSPDVPCRFLRMVFVRNMLTFDKFRKLQRAYMERVGFDPDSMGHTWNNQKKAIVNDRMTWKMFHKIIENILRLHIVKIKITVQKEDGQEEDYELKL